MKLHLFLVEIKNRLTVIFIQYFIALAAFFFNKENLVFFITSGAAQSPLSSFNTYLIFTSPSDIFELYWGSVFFASNVVLLLQISHSLLSFFSPITIPGSVRTLKSAWQSLFFSQLCVFAVFNYLLFPESVGFFTDLSESYSKRSPSKIFFEPTVLAFFYFYKDSYITASCVCGVYFLVYFGQAKEREVYVDRVVRYKKSIYFYHVFVSLLFFAPDVEIQVIFVALMLFASEVVFCFRTISFSRVLNKKTVNKAAN